MNRGYDRRDSVKKWTFIPAVHLSLSLFAVAALGGIYYGFFALDSGRLEQLFLELSDDVVALVYMAAIALIGSLVFQWASKMGGVIRFYDSFKYHFLSGSILLLGYVCIYKLNTPSFNIINDEPVISATASAIYFEDQAGIPIYSDWEEGELVIQEIKPDKRPLAMPVLLASIHALFGYNYQNVFVLNFLLGLTVVLLVYAVAFHICRNVLGALATALLWATFPLYFLASLGGGAELLNLAGILMLILLGESWLTKGRALDLSGMLFVGVLLAHTRYESAFYVLSCIVLVIVGWIRNRRLLFPLYLLFIPFLCLPLAWAYRLAQQTDGGAYMKSGVAQDDLFSPSHFYENLKSMFEFTFDRIEGAGSSPIMSIVASMAIIYLFRSFFLRRPRISQQLSSVSIAFMSVSVGVLLGVMLLLFYFWGDWTDPVVSRLSLPFFLMACLLVPVSGILASRRAQMLMILLCALSIVFQVGPRVKEPDAMTSYVERMAVIAMLETLEDVEKLASKRVYTHFPQAAYMAGFPSYPIPASSQSWASLSRRIDKGDELIVFAISPSLVDTLPELGPSVNVKKNRDPVPLPDNYFLHQFIVSYVSEGN
ncbi:MAG: hypothetical protein ACPGN3_04990 [Opitutales bacterium]